MNLKTLKELIFVLLKNIAMNNFFNRIMNTKCFINSNIYRHNNIDSKMIGACQYFSVKPLIYFRLCSFVVKRIKHEAVNVLSLL